MDLTSLARRTVNFRSSTECEVRSNYVGEISEVVIKSEMIRGKSKVCDFTVVLESQYDL